MSRSGEPRGVIICDVPALERFVAAYPRLLFSAQRNEPDDIIESREVAGARVLKSMRREIDKIRAAKNA